MTHYRVYDLRGIRAQLKDMGLDWDMPEYPPVKVEPVSAPTPLTVTIDMGPLPRYHFSPQQGLAVWSLAIALNPFNPEAYLQRG